MKQLLFLLFFFSTISIPSADHFVITSQGQTIASIHREDCISIFGEPFVNKDIIEEFINKVTKKVFLAPSNATIDKYGKIEQEKLGYKLDQQLFTEFLFAYLFENGPSTIEVPLTTLFPKVDSELLANIRVKKIGQYVTYFNHRNKARAQNITLAIDAINNTVVFPGEIFSFNKVVGQRTLEKGYLPAPIIIRGKFYDGVGGGICQVSSTLFNAVDLAGVKILERYSHSRRVRYVPPGRDATVSWHGPDFTFKNEYNQPILLQGKVYGGIVIITVYSSDVVNDS